MPRLVFWRRRAPLVAVLRLHGVIGGPARRRGGGLRLETLAPTIESAFKRRPAAVALSINSPGGSAAQSSLIARRIRALAAEKKTPVLAFCEDVAASGGYWLALAGDEIYVDDSSLVGSIGVIYASFGLTGLIARMGVERRVHAAGERKAMLDPFAPEKPEDGAHLEAVQADVHRAFIEHVRLRRGDKLKGDDADLFSGAFWSGRRAVDLGLADAVGDLRAVVRERFGERVRVRVVNPPRRRRRLLRLGVGAPALDGALDDLGAALEARSLWARYGF